MIKTWILAIRPRTLTLAIVPVIVGTALALYHDHRLNMIVLLITMLAAVLIQIATNLYNDALDSIRGVDKLDTRLGPPRAVASGWLRANQVMHAAHLTLVTAFLFGLYLIAHGGWPIFVVGMASLLAAWAYSAGPAPVSAAPVGELFVLLFFGLVAVAGSYYLQAGVFHLDAVLCGLALGLPAAAVLLVNNYRDMESDRQAGRRTLAIVIGPQAVISTYPALLLIPIAFAFALIDSANANGWRLLPMLAVPWALYLSHRVMADPPGPHLNRVLAGTTLYQVLLGALLCIAWWMTR